MSYGIKVEVWGDRALFTRPEMKAERVSYDVMTPSAARGLLEAIYWHPGMCWVIDRIHVMNPIKFTNVRRNEVKSKASSKKTCIVTSDDIQQRASMILTDVRYVIEAHFIITSKAAPTDNEGKFLDIINRRLKSGQCYHHPCFGCREFPAYFQPYEEKTIPTAYPDSERELGFMLYDMDYSDLENIQPKFFRAVLKNGVLDVTDCEVHQ